MTAVIGAAAAMVHGSVAGAAGELSMRQRVLHTGYNSTSYQILHPRIEHWVSGDGLTACGYVQRGRTWVVAGVPLAEDEQLGMAADELEAAARGQRCEVCYFAAESRLGEALKGRDGYSMIVIGAQPVWDPRRWNEKVSAHRSIREQLRRARSKGVRIERTGSPQRYRKDPELWECLNRWLASRPMPPLHFLTEPTVLDGELADRRLYLARQDGKLAGFVIATPVPMRRGWLLEQIVRDPAAPNGTTESMIDAVMRELAEEGCPRATLGMVVLSDYAPLAENPRWVRALFGWARAHGRRFYHFQGLQQYRAKLWPDAWEPLYAISSGRRFRLRTLYNIGRAFSDGALSWHVMRALSSAVWQETRWAGGRVLHRAIRP